MAESDLVEKIIKTLRIERPGLWFKIHGGPFQVVGIPDIIGCYEGKFHGIEVKLPGKENTLTKSQESFIKNIQKYKGVAGMVTSPVQALNLVKRIH